MPGPVLETNRGTFVIAERLAKPVSPGDRPVNTEQCQFGPYWVEPGSKQETEYSADSFNQYGIDPDEHC